jgi:hypothetical protein
MDTALLYIALNVIVLWDISKEILSFVIGRKQYKL